MLHYYTDCLMFTHMTYTTLLLWKNITYGFSDPPKKQQLFPWPFLRPSSSGKKTTGCSIGTSAGRRAASSSRGRWFVTQFNSGLYCWEYPLTMKDSLGVQSKNCSHHFLSLPHTENTQWAPVGSTLTSLVGHWAIPRAWHCQRLTALPHNAQSTWWRSMRVPR